MPESAPYVIFLDAISKAFCATGMRVGWGVMPPAIRRRMSDILGHVGAWAPKAEQTGVAAFLSRPDEVHAFRDVVRKKLDERLEALYDGVLAMKKDGFPVDAIEPQGAIYLSARFDLFGRTVKGVPVRTNDDVRRLLLEEAGLGVVPVPGLRPLRRHGMVPAVRGRGLDGGHRRRVPPAPRDVRRGARGCLSGGLRRAASSCGSRASR